MSPARRVMTRRFRTSRSLTGTMSAAHGLGMLVDSPVNYAAWYVMALPLRGEKGIVYNVFNSDVENDVKQGLAMPPFAKFKPYGRI